jgi:hypothetical protein
MTEEASVGVEIIVRGGVSRAGRVRAVLREGAGGVLGPEAVEDEGGVLGALGRGWVGGAELGGPGEVEEVVVEGLGGGWLKGKCCGARARWGFGCGLRRRGAGGDEEKRHEEGGCGSLLHGGRRIAGKLESSRNRFCGRG